MAENSSPGKERSFPGEERSFLEEKLSLFGKEFSLFGKEFSFREKKYFFFEIENSFFEMKNSLFRKENYFSGMKLSSPEKEFSSSEEENLFPGGGRPVILFEPRAYGRDEGSPVYFTRPAGFTSGRPFGQSLT